ncbi:MAG: TonB-dependent receptor plug domain-containing protein, partial [Candidatus Eisenbacteria bacterium]|nr:TonB-dependent receptor plug domain-containing protein [Candidatus Eisenbacteria bacterium]
MVSAAPADAPRDSARADSAARRVVRQFPAVEVRAILDDLRSTVTVHPISAVTMRALPIDGLADMVALQPGVVTQGEELHVRGGRAGETRVVLDGMTLNEPQRQHAMDVPLLALRSADLVSGAPETRYAGATAGVLDLHTYDPGEAVAGEWRWVTDARTRTHLDRVSGRVSAPLHFLGLGAVAAGDAMLDDTWLPSLRSASRHDVLGVPFGWRAENRMLGFLKLAPVAGPRRVSAQVLASRAVHRPFDPAWSADGWVGFDPLTTLPIFSHDEQPGYVRYRAADHGVTTDERVLATTVTLASARGAGNATLALGWLRARTLTAAQGIANARDIVGPQYDTGSSGDPFYVLYGDYPLFRRSASDVWSLRGDVDRTTPRGTRLSAGAGATYESVSLWELDTELLGNPSFNALRAYRAYAPGAFAYGQGRWTAGEMVVNAGLRLDWWTPGPQAGGQTFPATSRGRGLVSPRLGFAFPISARDVFSFSYARLNQAPPRDVLYDNRVSITDRQPLGDASIRPAVMVSYEAALKRALSPLWAFQASLFYRDAAQLAGAREYVLPSTRPNLRYTDQDQASSAGLELSLLHAPDDRRRIEIHYTLMRAWGFEARSEGDPYGPTRDIRMTPISEMPLSWDRRQSLGFLGALRWRRWSWAWSSVVGAPLPWTPKPFRAPVTDLATVNSRRFEWTETTNFNVQYAPAHALGLELGLEAKNLFNSRAERAATVDGYPNPSINTVYDDYG